MAKKPKQHGSEWTREIIAEFKRMVKDRHPVKAVSKALARTEAAVRKKAFDLGISFRRKSKAATKPAARKAAKKAAKRKAR